MIDQIGGRKLVAAFIVLAVALVIVFIKGDVPANLLSLLQVVFAAFVAGNVGEHVTDVVQAHVTASASASTQPVEPTAAPQAIDLSPVISDLAQIKSGIATTQQGVSAILQMASAARQ